MHIVPPRPAPGKPSIPTSCPKAAAIVELARLAPPCRRCTLVLQNKKNPGCFRVFVPRCLSRTCAKCRPVVDGLWCEHLAGVFRLADALHAWRGPHDGAEAACRRATRAGGQYAALMLADGTSLTGADAEGRPTAAVAVPSELAALAQTRRLPFRAVLALMGVWRVVETYSEKKRPPDWALLWERLGLFILEGSP